MLSGFMERKQREIKKQLAEKSWSRMPDVKLAKPSQEGKDMLTEEEKDYISAMEFREDRERVKIGGMSPDMRNKFKQDMKEQMHKDLTARGMPLPDTSEHWKNLAKLYAATIEKQKVEIERLQAKVNKLTQKRKWVI